MEVDRFAGDLLGTGRTTPLLAFVALPPLVLLPWKLWLRVNDVPPTPVFRPDKLLEPGYLTTRIGRLGDAATEIASVVVEPRYWLALVPIVVAATVVAARVSPQLAILAGGILVGGIAALTAVYWTSPYNLDYLINTSASRVVSPIIVASALLLPLLGAAILMLGPEDSFAHPPAPTARAGGERAGLSRQ